MALYKHWCAQGTIDSTRMIYRHILRRTRHTRNYTHKIVLKAQSNLHKCALVAQHCTQNHRYLAGLLTMQPYLVRKGVAVVTEDCAGTGVDLCVGCLDENEAVSYTHLTLPTTTYV